MLRTVEAVIDENGHVRLLEPVLLPAERRALVTILQDEPTVSEMALLSEETQTEDWGRPEEDAAWSYCLAPCQGRITTGRISPR